MSLSPSQNKIVIGLTIGVAIVIIVLAAVANCGCRNAMPPYPPLAGPTDTVKAQIANYEALSEVVEKEETFLYDLIVVKVLYPLLVVLIGAITAVKLFETFTAFMKARNGPGK